jgi:hypothetical protein
MAALITFKVDVDMNSGLPSDNLLQATIDVLKEETG